MTDKKYTLQQYAAIQGGHEMTSDDTSLSFMQTLGEARMYKSKHEISREGARSITDHIFVSMMSIYAMSQDYNYAPVAKEYSKRTTSRGNFKNPSPSGTDLYQTLYTVNNSGSLLTSEKDKLLMAKVRIQDSKIKQFLKRIESGNVTKGEAQTFFFKLEKDLAITDPKLRAARRLTQNWGDLTTAQRTLVATQINKYYRVDARRSDMYPIFTKFAKDGGLLASSGKTKKIAKRIARGAAAMAVGYAAGRATEL